MKRFINLLILITLIFFTSSCGSKVESTLTSDFDPSQKIEENEKGNDTVIAHTSNSSTEYETITPSDSTLTIDDSNNNSSLESTPSTPIQDSNNLTTSDNLTVATTIRDIPSTELVKDIKIGWNLGNTLDATGEGLSSELSWGNPFTTKENIDKVKEAGFNLVRIPTTWENHLTSTVTYIIHPSWLERVKEIVDYAIGNDMYVILNLHHEEWHYPSYENEEDAKEQLIAIWTQIGDYFKDYDEHLIFEAMNEPSMVGSKYEWTSGTAESRDIINQLNLAFIHTIRNQGGNNEKRHLMIPPYAASSNKDAWVDFVVPKDDKIIISIHGYAPYDFALNKEGTSDFRSDLNRHTRSIDELMMNLDTHFIQNNIPVIIGEFGAVDKDNINDRVIWSTYYVQKAYEKGIPCVWWDNGAFIGDGENFGLLDRRNNIWVFPEIIDALMLGLESIEVH